MHFTGRIANYINCSDIILLTLTHEGIFAGMFSNLFILDRPKPELISSLLLCNSRTCLTFSNTKFLLFLGSEI